MTSTLDLAPPTAGDPARTAALVRRQAVLDRLLAAEGAGHVVHDLPLRADHRAVAVESRPWRLDPDPLVLAAADFAQLEQLVRERMTGLEAVLTDLYGPRTLVTDGVVAPDRLWASSRYRTSMIDTAPPNRWLTTYSVDVVRTTDGTWHAVADHTDAPAGLGYAQLNRAVMRQAQQRESVADVRRPRPIAPYLGALRESLIEAAGTQSPRIVVLTGGIDHSSYVEHSYLATQLGYNLVEGPDLVVRQRKVWLRTLGGVEPVDVIYRRLEAHALDPMEVNAIGSAGIPGVLLAQRSGGVTLANAHGCGVIESDQLVDSVDAAIEAMTGHRPQLALRHQRGTVREVLGADPVTTDVLVDGALVAMPFVVRMQAIATDGGVVVVPGGAGRVVDPSDDPRIPTPCVAKDVWVPGPEQMPPLVVRPTSQVDLIASVPTRAADSLYWLNRAAERAEAIARTARAVIAVRERDVGSFEYHPLADLLGIISGRPVGAPDGHGSDAGGVDAGSVSAALDLASLALADRIGAILVEAASVREFMSTTTGRVLGELVEVRAGAQSTADVEVFDAALLRLSAFAGLWNESVVRGPAWHFGDFARRYERCLVVLSGVRHALVAGPFDPVTLEAVLAANDSLVAYRRRHRSDVESSAVFELLVRDERNPRSAMAALAALGRDAARVEWTDGATAMSDLRRQLRSGLDADRVDHVIAELHRLASELVHLRLITPPDPRVIRRATSSLRSGIAKRTGAGA